MLMERTVANPLDRVVQKSDHVLQPTWSLIHVLPKISLPVLQYT